MGVSGLAKKLRLSLSNFLTELEAKEENRILLLQMNSRKMAKPIIKVAVVQ
jgi:hypothetical protein